MIGYKRSLAGFPERQLRFFVQGILRRDVVTTSTGSLFQFDGEFVQCSHLVFAAVESALQYGCFKALLIEYESSR